MRPNEYVHHKHLTRVSDVTVMRDHSDVILGVEVIHPFATTNPPLVRIHQFLEASDKVATSTQVFDTADKGGNSSFVRPSHSSLVV